MTHGNTQSLFYELFYELILNPKLEFCIIDEFCKHLNAENLLEDNSGVKRRRRQASLSDSEIMTILLYFYFGTFRNFKHYYLFFIKGTMKSYFPKAVILYKTLGYPELRSMLRLFNKDIPSIPQEYLCQKTPKGFPFAYLY